MDTKPAGAAPAYAALHEAALRHLSRFAATEATLVRVLDRRIQRWARLAEAAGEDPGPGSAAARVAAREVAGALVRAGVIDDGAFAAARTARLLRAGRSRRAMSAHLAAKGVPAEAVAAVLPDEAQEFAAALAFAQRRHIGPFGPNGAEGPADGVARRKEAAALARAGFGHDVARRVFETPAEDAAAQVAALKRG